MKKLFGLFCINVLLYAVPVNATEHVDIVRYLSDYNQYQTELIKQALEITVPEYGPFEFDIKTESIPSLRIASEVGRGDMLNIFAAPAIGAIADIEDLIQIPIPITKGIAGFRILVIKSTDQNKFNNIHNISDLKTITLGQQHGWIDISIYKNSGIEVKSTPRFEALYPMLSRGRFDAIPLGADVVFEQYKLHVEQLPSLAIENSIAIYYPHPLVFYVSRKHPEIAKRILDGLEKMIVSGQLDTLFYQYHSEVLKNLHLNKRRILKIANPFLSKNLPFDRKELWLPEAVIP